MENYILKKLISETNVYKVYLANNQEDDVQVVLKVFQTELIDEYFEKRFNKWTNILLKLEHPNLLTYIDFLCEHGKYAYVIEDTCFSSILSLFENKELDNVLIYQIFLQLLEVTDYAHNKGIVNGNLVLDKIYFEENRVLIEDFGINNLIFPSLSLVHRKQDVTNYSFYSPEQFEDKEIGFASDIYSLGALLYTLTEKRLPFHNLNGFEDLKKAINQTEFLEVSKSNIFAPFIEKATMNSPENRYISVKYWLEEWKEFGKEIVNAKMKFIKKEKKPIQKQDVLITEKVKDTDDLEKLRLRSKKRFTFLVFMSLLLFFGFIYSVVKDEFYNPLSLNFYTNNNLDRVFVLPHTKENIELLSSSQNYVFSLRLNIDSVKLLSSDVLDFSYNFLGNILVFGQDVVIVGGRSINKLTTFPLLFIIRSQAYEPYYKIEENGFYVDVDHIDGNIYLLKYLSSFSKENYKLVISKRDYMLEQKESFEPNASFLLDSLIPKAMKIVKDLIIIEFYNFESHEIKILGFDNKGNVKWQEVLHSVPISDDTTWYNIDKQDKFIWVSTLSKKKKNKLNLYAIDYKGNKKLQASFNPGINVKSIERLRVLSDSSIMVSLFSKRNYSLLLGFDKSGNLIFKRRLGYLDLVKITDFYLVDQTDLILAGIRKSFLSLDTINSSEIYFLKMKYYNEREN